MLTSIRNVKFIKCMFLIEDITRWREDMNFMFEWQEQYLTSERSERVKYCSCHENIKFISSSQRVMFFLLYKHTDDGVFYDFPKISDHFPKISEDFPKLFRRPDERSRRLLSEDFRRLPKTFEEDPKMFRWYTNEFKYNLRDKLDITEIISYLHMWGYRIVFINLLPLAIPLTFI